jgi:hypothetical protein
MAGALPILNLATARFYSCVGNKDMPVVSKRFAAS